MTYWRESLAVAQRILLELLRRRRSLILWAIFPLTLLEINSTVIADRLQLSMAAALAWVAPSALVGSALFFSCLGGTVATIVAEREHLTLKRLFLSPLGGFSYFSGIFLAHSCVGMAQAVLIYAGAALGGAWFAGNLLLGLVVVALSVVVYVALGFILSTQMARRTEDVNSIVAAFGMPLLILGGAFFPTSFFPPSLLRIAAFNPVYHMNEALVAVSKDASSAAQISQHLSFLLAFALLAAALAWVAYQRMLATEKRL
jgi:ABC-2 type transport system permease protein